MIAFAFSATAINYLDRPALSVTAPRICDHFRISNVQYSRILFCFLLSYTLMNGVSGSLIDRLGTRIGYALCMAWWSISAILHVFATGFYSLAAYRFLLGMVEAGNWPGAVKVVAEWFPAQDRAFAAGLGRSIQSAAGAPVEKPRNCALRTRDRGSAWQDCGWPTSILRRTHTLPSSPLAQQAHRELRPRNEM